MEIEMEIERGEGFRARVTRTINISKVDALMQFINSIQRT